MYLRFQRLPDIRRASSNSEPGEGFYVLFKHLNKIGDDPQSAQDLS